MKGQKHITCGKTLQSSIFCEQWTGKRTMWKWQPKNESTPSTRYRNQWNNDSTITGVLRFPCGIVCVRCVCAWENGWTARWVTKIKTKAPHKDLGKNNTIEQQAKAANSGKSLAAWRRPWERKKGREQNQSRFPGPQKTCRLYCWWWVPSSNCPLVHCRARV